ncbi:DUF429 domain-containing protein [Vibrio sp. FNV 38]|nr:DUF429 domain-containing protein [Vibrio sp. FNV 38]
MNYLGVDGCKFGWCYWYLSHGSLLFGTASTLKKLFNQVDMENTYCLIDMPIGFSDTNTPDRLCDKAARKQLTKIRQSSVFSVPCKSAVYTNNYEDACEVNVSQLGKKLSKQTWGIVPKIRALDEFRKNHSEFIIRESHPEVAFMSLAGVPLTSSKRSPEGIQERIDLLESLSTQLELALEQAFMITPKKVAMPDDIVDALVLCMASQSVDRLVRLPREADTDMFGNCREIVYPEIFERPVINHFATLG